MKKYILSAAINLFIINILFSQNTFDWNDVEFEIGNQRMLEFRFDFDGLCTMKPCHDYQNNAAEYDKLIHFLAENPELKVSIKYVFHKDTRVSNIVYYQRSAKGKTKGLQSELIKLNALNRQIEFGEFEFSDTLKAISGYELTIIETELPNHIQQAISDTTVNYFYNQPFDYFKLQPDTTDNQALDNLGFYLEKLLQNDTSLVIEMNPYYDSRFLRYSIRIGLSEKTTQYLINNFDIEANKFKKVCTIKPYFTENDNHVVIIKIVTKKDSKNCIEKRIKDRCENCPF